MLSREKTYPALLITSALGTPEWMSSIETIKLAVGLCDFTCCQRNHTFPGIGVVPCDRDITREILETLIASKVENLYKVNQIKLARLFHCMTQWWTRRPSPSTRVQRCESFAELKHQLKWDENIDGQDEITPWTDRCGISILAYGMAVNELSVVKEILKLYKTKQTDLLAWRFPKEGVVEVGIPGLSTCLYGAMCFASPEIVVALLGAGADMYASDVMDNDPLMAACGMNRLDNVKIWFSTLEWDVNRRNKSFGATALSIAFALGSRNLDLIHFLLKQGANMMLHSHSGNSCLHDITMNDDCDLRVLRFILSRSGSSHMISKRKRGTTIKWRMILNIMPLFLRCGTTLRSNIVKYFGILSGTTPLHCAVRRGDVDVVEILLQFGANPSVRDSLGCDVRSYCKAFPEIKGAIERIKREAERNQGRTRERKSDESVEATKGTTSFTLQRRLSTATDIKHDMYLMSLSTIMKLFGSPLERKKNLQLCHQDLLKREKLTRFEDLPMGSFVIFVSHQWNGFDHPDPSGHQMQVLSNVLRKLRDGIYRTEMDPFHVIVYKDNTVTSPSEWKELLTNAYIWYDWFSQPQPSRGTSKEEIARLKRGLNSAVDSVSAYVERADTLMILAPSSVHADIVDKKTGRKTYTCYRTWRRRGFCVLEFLCAYLSRRSTHPVLLVRSDLDTPSWISNQESLKLGVGNCEFTCCQTNHLGSRRDSKMKCSRPNVSIILSKMIDAKANYHFTTTKNILYGRMTRVMKHWWMRNIDKKGWLAPFIRQNNLRSGLETRLEWDENMDGTFFDRNGISLLIYAVCADDADTVEYVINEINRDFQNNSEERCRRIESRISKYGILHFGFQGLVTSLIIAMAGASCEIVRLLLENGADPYAVEITGSDALMMACALNRVQNVKFWLKRFPGWNLEAKNTALGGFALGTSVYVGPNKFKLTKLLLESGARIDTLTHRGSSPLIAACSNEDCDPCVVKLLLKHDAEVNLQFRARTMKWKFIHFVAKGLTRVLNTSNGLLRSIAGDSGSTSLHYAAMRGDMEIVELLLSAGADPSVKQDLGHNAAGVCKSFPELQGVLEKRERKTKLRGATKKTKAVEVLGKRISTATPIQHEMWLISLETLLMLYVYSCLVDFSLKFSYLTLTPTQVRRRKQGACHGSSSGVEESRLLDSMARRS